MLKRSLKYILVFTITYVLFLGFWIKTKDFYALGITRAASSVVSLVKGVEILGMEQKKDYMVVSFQPRRFKSSIIVDITVKTSVYTFNAPVSFAIMATMFDYLRRRHRRLVRVYLEALTLLVLVHLVFVFSVEGERITNILVQHGYEKQNNLKLFLWQFLWQFTDNMIIRFEPFLLGAYLYLRRPVK